MHSKLLLEDANYQTLDCFDSMSFGFLRPIYFIFQNSAW